MEVVVLAAWPLILVAAKLVARLRWRFVLVFAVGWLTALVIATTGEPHSRAAMIGPVFGAVGAVFVWLVTRRGVRLTWMPGEVFLRDDNPTPKVEYVVAAVIAIAALASLLA
ncbi:hypothetical protein [Kribbella solani]|uniref:hypothetical protein n=1 Tax=Kribbella solani TaxID=236067 RepID=UPI0029A21349|nr:hypothetical protein [Kribbella solani]MDX2974674.1 hypothetical protein [Kribbella solani]